MSVRKRTWTNQDGTQGEAWVAAYTDFEGTRRIRTFEKKHEAAAYHASVSGELQSGLHVPDSQSVTVAEAGRLWLQGCEAAGLERSTLDYYRQHLERHITPLIGSVKLSRLTVPMVRKARVSLGALLGDAQERGLVGQNVVRTLRKGRRRGKDARTAARQNGKLKVGIDIPSPDEIRAIIAAASDGDSDGRRPLLLTAIFTGLRASELRGLRWSDIDFKRSALHVRQRADRYGKIGSPKSKAGERTVPLPPMLVNVLRAWKLACPKGELDLAFPSNRGGVEKLSNIVESGLIPIGVAAGVVTRTGKAKYSGLHTLRHFYASWCINLKKDGGLELPLKLVSARLGHASIQMTADRYGHLFPSTDDGSELAAAEKTLWGSASRK